MLAKLPTGKIQSDCGSLIDMLGIGRNWNWFSFQRHFLIFTLSLSIPIVYRQRFTWAWWSAVGVFLSWLWFNFIFLSSFRVNYLKSENQSYWKHAKPHWEFPYTQNDIMLITHENIRFYQNRQKTHFFVSCTSSFPSGTSENDRQGALQCSYRVQSSIVLLALLAKFIF